MASLNKRSGGLVVDFEVLDGDVATEGFFKGDEGLGAGQAQGLQLFVDDAEHVTVVLGVDFDEHVVLAGGVVAFHDLRNFVERLHHVAEMAWIFEEDAQEGTGLVTDLVGVQDEFRAFDDAQVGELLNALVDGSA